MIREAVETLDPPGALLSEDGVLRKYGPEPVHEAQAIVDALTAILNEVPNQNREPDGGWIT